MVYRGSERALLKIFDVTYLEYVAEFRIKIGITAEIVSAIGKGHKRRQVIVERSPDPSAVARLYCVLFGQVVRDMGAGKEVCILAGILLVRLLYSGLYVCSFCSQTCLI